MLITLIVCFYLIDHRASSTISAAISTISNWCVCVYLRSNRISLLIRCCQNTTKRANIRIFLQPFYQDYLNNRPLSSISMALMVQIQNQYFDTTSNIGSLIVWKLDVSSNGALSNQSVTVLFSVLRLNFACSAILMIAIQMSQMNQLFCFKINGMALKENLAYRALRTGVYVTNVSHSRFRIFF